MRRFTLGSGADRKVVVIELDGRRMTVVRIMPDGSTKRTEQVLGTEVGARAASEQLARELIARGYKEKVGRSVTQAKAAAWASEAAAAGERGIDEIDGSSLFDEVEAPVATASPVIPRLSETAAANPVIEVAPPKKKKAAGKKKRKKAEGDDGLDKRVLAGIGAVVAVFFGIFGYMAYDAFLKPPTIVGTWSGSLLEHEVSRKLSHTRYDLILDEQKRASLTLQQKYTTTGTYSVKGNVLKLSLKDEDGMPDEREYKFVLGRRTLDLNDPRTGELAVQLLRFEDKPAVGGAKPAAPKAPTNIGEADKDEDARIASVEMSPKDSAFRIRHPQDWEHDTGSRPDNTYSWCKFTKGGAQIDVYADIQGSLMSGSDSRREPQEEGSEMAPVHVAHELYKKTVAEGFNDYNESKPAVLKGSKLGEGRISEFTAKSGGLLGSRLRGYHATLLTNDRRVSIICQCPEKEFAQFKPTFLAVCRSLSR
jgi:hypothetical protein